MDKKGTLPSHWLNKAGGNLEEQGVVGAGEVPGHGSEGFGGDGVLSRGPALFAAAEGELELGPARYVLHCPANGGVTPLHG